MEITPEEDQAGFSEIAKTFGISLILDNISTKCYVKEDEILEQWSVGRFYNKVRMYSWQAYAEKIYNKSMAGSK